QHIHASVRLAQHLLTTEHLDAVSVSRAVGQFARPLPLAQEHVLERLGICRGLHGTQQLMAPLSDRLRTGIAIEQLRAMVPEDDGATKLPQEDGVVCALQYARLQVHLLLLATLLR